jgi:pimeloyl-ACP methyl ester carboxylesterase
VTLFGWDWRKETLASLDPLDRAIIDALETDGPWKQQSAKRVVLVGHSYGGLLMTRYVRDKPERVARTLTIGTPYWGAPKSIFPLAFGFETPGFSMLDLVLDPTALRQLAINLAGLYDLYPSGPFGPWLTVDGRAYGAGGGVRDYVQTIGGNVPLMQVGQENHEHYYEGFYDNDGTIDVRAVIGTGVDTIGSVRIRTPFGLAVNYINGDGTVPMRSGAQGDTNAAPMGDPIHRQYTCYVDHIDLPNHMPLLEAYRDFLDTGAVPRRLSDPCPLRGGRMDLTGELGVAPPAPTDSQPPVVGLDEAETQGLAEVIRLPDHTVVATSTRRQLTLRVQITDGTLIWQALDGDGVGAGYIYESLSGTLEITPAADVSELPLVTLDGRPVSPQSDPVPPEEGCNGGCNAEGRSSGVVAVALVALLRRRRRPRLGGVPRTPGERTAPAGLVGSSGADQLVVETEAQLEGSVSQGRRVPDRDGEKQWRA